jgi:hypothetical protein
MPNVIPIFHIPFHYRYFGMAQNKHILFHNYELRKKFYN